MDFKKLMETRDSVGLAVLRVVTGAVFIAHGLPKFGFIGDGNLAKTAEMLGSMGIPLPAVSAFLVAATETFGGAQLLADPFRLQGRFVFPQATERRDAGLASSSRTTTRRPPASSPSRS